MADDERLVPDHLVIRVTRPDDPVAEIGEVDAWQAREAYPEVRMGAPDYGYAEQADGTWRVIGNGGWAPQGARDLLAAHLGRLAAATDSAALQGEYDDAVRRLEGERRDAVTVAGRRYQVFRIERFVRFGTDGPEPPRASDADPFRTGEAYKALSRMRGLVIDPDASTGMAEGVARLELGRAIPIGVPAAVRADTVRAFGSHPGVVLLPAEFGTSERVGGQWTPDHSLCATPQSARDLLAIYLTDLAPRLLTPAISDEDRKLYTEAAERLQAYRLNELHVAGRLFRIIRVEQAVRVGPEGPEPPRPSDPDPDLPSEAQRLY
jgi:hypothetical protein